MLGVSVRKMKVLTMKVESVTVIGSGSYNWMCSVY
jgi:hypothetical protein